MRILCILQNAWGDRELPITFIPNPFNKSAKTIRKMVGDNFFMFSNTTDVVTKTSREKPKPNYEHFEKVIKRIKYFDMVLVCGKQAEETVNKYMTEIESQGKPIMFVPHPAARNLTNAKCEEIREQIKKYEKSMTQEDKQLLLKDLCARLPYITYYDLSYYGHKTRAVLQELITTKDPLKSLVKVNTVVSPIPYENIKPYLRPLSSMTEEEKTLMTAICLKNAIGDVEGAVSELSDFYNSRHFDYRGLIPMGIALEAPEGMYKNE